jgi:hypothetical protein
MAFHVTPFHEQRKFMELTKENDNQGSRNINHLSELAQRFSNVKQEIADIERALKAKIMERERLEKQEIPDFMTELGLNACTLPNGYSITLKNFYYARIPAIDEKKPETIVARKKAFDWLREHGHGGLIKEEIKLWPDARTRSLMLEFFEEFKIPFDETESVHHKTLEAWFKGQVESGSEVPQELFKGYVGRVADIKV